MANEVTPCFCDACSRSMTTASGRTVVGISIQINSNEDDLQQLYPEVEFGKSYNVCWVCWLKSLGVSLAGSPSLEQRVIEMANERTELKAVPANAADAG